ncbi:hypothetical protein CBFG_01319 [Clostridiales bacterium 1_7_47FAA]|nr:hypothetical protein CBFG_01319 [Clostridiales bacterium 1_7_47FAA]
MPCSEPAAVRDSYDIPYLSHACYGCPSAMRPFLRTRQTDTAYGQSFLFYPIHPFH